MPQPYRGKGQVVYARGLILAMPNVAVHITEISLLWTFIEEAWAFLLACMLRAEAGAGLTIYQALAGTGAQRAVMNEIADEYLPKKFRAEFGVLMDASKRRAKERNAVVHGMWFIDGAIPDALILAPRRVLSEIVIKTIRKARATKQGAEPKAFSDAIGDFKKWRVYKEHDFELIEARLLAHFRHIDGLIDKVREYTGDSPNETLKHGLQSASSAATPKRTIPLTPPAKPSAAATPSKPTGAK